MAGLAYPHCGPHLPHTLARELFRRRRRCLQLSGPFFQPSPPPSSQPAVALHRPPMQARQRVRSTARKLLTPPASLSPQLRGLIGIRMEVAEAALHRPSRARRTTFGDTFASLFIRFRWLKLVGMTPAPWSSKMAPAWLAPGDMLSSSWQRSLARLQPAGGERCLSRSLRGRYRSCAA